MVEVWPVLSFYSSTFIFWPLQKEKYLLWCKIFQNSTKERKFLEKQIPEFPEKRNFPEKNFPNFPKKIPEFPEKKKFTSLLSHTTQFSFD